MSSYTDGPVLPQPPRDPDTWPGPPRTGVAA